MQLSHSQLPFSSPNRVRKGFERPATSTANKILKDEANLSTTHISTTTLAHGGLRGIGGLHMETNFQDFVGVGVQRAAVPFRDLTTTLRFSILKVEKTG